MFLNTLSADTTTLAFLSSFFTTSMTFSWNSPRSTFISRSGEGKSTSSTMSCPTWVPSALASHGEACLLIKKPEALLLMQTLKSFTQVDIHPCRLCRFWFRLYWFPLKVLWASCVTSIQSVPNIPFYFFFNTLLFALLLMNIYWFLVRMGSFITQWQYSKAHYSLQDLSMSIREALGCSRVVFPNPGTGVLPTMHILDVSKSNTPPSTVKILRP